MKHFRKRDLQVEPPADETPPRIAWLRLAALLVTVLIGIGVYGGLAWLVFG